MNEKPLRILFFSDTHLGFDLPIHPRIQRRRRGHDFFANYHRILDFALTKQVDLIVHGGDVFYRSRVHPSIVDHAYQPLLDLANAGIHIYLVPGNHERSRLPSQLWLTHSHIHLFDKPRTFLQGLGDEVIALSGFPFTRSVKDHFLPLLQQSNYRAARAGIHFLCLHQAFEGAKVGAHDFTFRSSPDTIPGLAVPGEFTATLSGHIHRSQLLMHDLKGRPLPSPILYSGSIERTSFAERLEEKHFVYLKILRGRAKPELITEFHPLPTRPMVRLEFEPHADRLGSLNRELQTELSNLDPNAVVQLHLIGRDAELGREVVSMRSLRRISPATMNISLAYPRNELDHNQS